ncbi:leucine-rich repeat domain-containing protein [Spirosoma validum]|uniref:Leucine-rich repeat domain-containing protein n=1 Tax=Spirosoma validum TaxID=2771355 RepID=A0A927B441_9BACT|nr:leucine-rich repeat domain-containing protein [Spirosoma validum]MBD2754953.1 leucine-rich repeat domain-containing protein [Spirosoma validum]
MTPPLALELINKAYAEKSTFLDLGNCGLTFIPEEITKLASFLKELNMGSYYYKLDQYVESENEGASNDFSNSEVDFNIFQKLALTGLFISKIHLSSSIIPPATNLTNLVSLQIAENALTDVQAEYIGANFKDLKSFDISRNQLSARGAQHIANNLEFLTSLNISENQVTDEGAQYIASNLKSLTSLDISYNRLTDEGVKCITNLESLIALQISSSKLTGLGVQYITTHLKNLISLDISFNSLTDAEAQQIAQYLKNLTRLDISSNQITDEGALHIAHNLKALTYLQISGNHLTARSAQAIATNLKSLNSLRISENQLRDNGIELLVNMPKLTFLFARDNRTDSIPETLLDNIKALRDYFKAEQLNKLVDNNFVKVILMGNTTSGKSSLANYLVDGTYIPGRKSTHGIQLWKWHTDPENPRNDLTVNIWDFGGQDYYHATHTLFRSAKTLFLFLHTDEESHKQSKPEENQYLKEEYWLANIQSLAGERSFAWFIQSKYEPDFTGTSVERIFLNAETAKKLVRNQFAISVKKTSENDLDSFRSFTYFRESLKTELQKLATEKLQASWVEIRDQHLVEWRKNKADLCMTKKMFWKKCQKAVADGPFQNDFSEKPEVFLKYLRDCGEIVWFENNAELKDQLYLSVDELTTELFKLLNKEYIDQQGSFTLSALTTVDQKALADYLKILLEFKLIFRKINTTDTFVVPQYLPENPYTIHFQQLIQIAYAIRFAYLPRSLVTQFLVTYANVEGSYYWRYGAFFRKGSFRLFVQMDAYQQTVAIHVSDGPTREKYSILKDLFEFFTQPERNELNRPGSMPLSKNRVMPSERFFLSDGARKTIQLSSDGVEFVTITNLEEAILNKITKVKSATGNYLTISPVMHQLLVSQAQIPKKIFLSYAHKDELYKKELDTHFAALKRSGLVETWQDREILAGDDWDKVIKEAIQHSDIVLLLLSPDFMASDYIWNTELPAAKEHGTEIIPLFIRPCDFEETQFAIYKQQGLPGYEGPKTDLDKAKTRWIVSSDFPNRDEGYLKIVEGVKAKLKTP